MPRTGFWPLKSFPKNVAIAAMRAAATLNACSPSVAGEAGKAAFRRASTIRDGIGAQTEFADDGLCRRP